jgi:hypothetical protein
LDEFLAAHSVPDRLEARDCVFVHAIAATALRRLGQINALITYCPDLPQESYAWSTA